MTNKLLVASLTSQFVNYYYIFLYMLYYYFRFFAFGFTLIFIEEVMQHDCLQLILT